MNSKHAVYKLEQLKSFDIGKKGLTVRAILGLLVARHIENLIDSDPTQASQLLNKDINALLDEAEENIMTDEFFVDLGLRPFSQISVGAEDSLNFKKKAA